MLPKIIVVEGIDRVGKTTLVNKLANELGYSIYKDIPFHYTRTEESEGTKMFGIVSALNSTKDKVVIDRLHLSEFIYGNIERGYASIYAQYIDTILSNLDSLLIYVRPVDVVRSSKEHGSDLKEHSEMFELLYKASSMNKVSCDYNSLDIIIESIKAGAYK